MISRKIPSTNGAERPYNAKISIRLLKESFQSGWYVPSLALVLLLATGLDFWQLGLHGYSNLYYAASVRSMLINPHNFFFAAYDPNGFITIDKPPLDFWIQVLSAKLLGFKPFSLLLPQALAGVLSVALLAHLVRRSFGKLAGLLAALALTLTPISVITSRNNDVDSMLVLVTLLAAWAMLIAVERGSLRWLLLSMGLVGVGFNIKMAEAYLIIPAFVLLYLLTSPQHWRTKIWHLMVAGIISLAVSLSWSAAVDFTPPAQRPFVGSSKANSEILLAFGYNGIHRLFKAPASPPHRQVPINKAPFQPPLPGKAVIPPQNPFSGGVDGFPSPMRLFNNQLAGQIGWLLPLALIGTGILLWRVKKYTRHDRSGQGMVLWGTWFLTVGAFFSATASFQIYYMVMLSPAICALVGIGVATLWREYAQTNARGLLLPLAFLITAAMQVHFLSPFPAWRDSELPTLIFTIITIVALILFIIHPLKKVKFVHIPALLTAFGLLALLLAPTLWTILPILANYNTGFPVAGPYGTTTPTFAHTHILITIAPQNTALTSSALSLTDLQLLSFLKIHQGRSRYLYATTTSNYSESAIIETGKGVMTMGGYAGEDQILTRAQLIKLVHNGMVHYFLLPGSIPPLLRDLTNWIKSACQMVPHSVWYHNKHFPQGTRFAGLILYEYTGISPLHPHPHHGHPIHIRHAPPIKLGTH